MSLIMGRWSKGCDEFSCIIIKLRQIKIKIRFLSFTQNPKTPFHNVYLHVMVEPIIFIKTISNCKAVMIDTCCLTLFAHSVGMYVENA